MAFAPWYLVQTVIETTVYRDWQAETRALAMAVKQASGPVLVYGEVTALSSGKAAGLQSELALMFRIQQLTGRNIVLCQIKAETCKEIDVTTDHPMPLRVKIAKVNDQTRLTYPTR